MNKHKRLANQLRKREKEKIKNLCKLYSLEHEIISYVIQGRNIFFSGIGL
jgi:hypothetical protein